MGQQQELSQQQAQIDLAQLETQQHQQRYMFFHSQQARLQAAQPEEHKHLAPIIAQEYEAFQKNQEKILKAARLQAAAQAQGLLQVSPSSGISSMPSSSIPGTGTGAGAGKASRGNGNGKGRRVGGEASTSNNPGHPPTFGEAARQTTVKVQQVTQNSFQCITKLATTMERDQKQGKLRGSSGN